MGRVEWEGIVVDDVVLELRWCWMLMRETCCCGIGQAKEL